MVSQSYIQWDKAQIIRPYTKYKVLAENMGRMFRAFSLKGETIVDLTLCRIPFLDLKGVAAIVDLCPKLQRCEILKCEMIRFHQLAPFFRHYVPNGKKHVRFDISPLFEVGPSWVGSPERKGTYGLTHSDSGSKLPVSFAKQCLYHLFPAIYGKPKERSILVMTITDLLFCESCWARTHDLGPFGSVETVGRSTALTIGLRSSTHFSLRGNA